MLFHDSAFFVFLPLVFGLFYLVPRQWRNSILLVANLCFYAYGSGHFLWLMLLSAGIDYWCGLRLGVEEDPFKRKAYLWTALSGNLLILGTFKYGPWVTSAFGPGWVQNFVLPAGISFYTFQSMAYTIDVYRRDIRPERNLAHFYLFISFFPQLVAGPIERAKHLLPQFFKDHKYHDIDWDGAARLLLLGYFKKLVIADRLGAYVDVVYAGTTTVHPAVALTAFHFFIFQVYCDFSGYSDIARGLGKLFGIEIAVNFRWPLWSRNIKELLRRWHITLVDWFQSYVFIPLGGSRAGTSRTALNILVVCGLSGLWHGPDVTFVIWGLLLGVSVMVINTGRVTLPAPVAYVLTFEFWTIATGVFFRGRSWENATRLLKSLGGDWHMGMRDLIRVMSPITRDLHFVGEFLLALVLIGLFCFIDLRDRKGPLSTPLCALLLVVIILFGKFNEKTFIYFNF